ncbi:hypothetical protein Ancab_024295 [Ancistrocladus abbreviatus]
MEGDRKKRRVVREDEEDEDVKMEKFFALIKNSWDLRGSLLGGEQSRDGGKKKAEDEQRQSAPIWRPCFEPEDFGLNVLLKGDPTAEACPSRGQKENGKESEGNENGGSGLDLNLSL